MPPAAAAPIEGWREALIEVGRDLYAHGLVTSHGGNMSVRRPAGGALITATGAMLGRLDGSRLVSVDEAGAPLLAAAAAPSSNTDIHVAIYRAHPAARAVLHAHPPYAVARTLAPEADALEPANFEARVLLGRIPIVEGELAQTPDLVAQALHACPIVLVRGHGSFAAGPDLWQALNYTSALEEAAQILTLAAR